MKAASRRRLELHLSIQDMVTLVKGMDLKAERRNELFQTQGRVKRNVGISGGNVPPGEALALDIGGLEQC